MSEVSELYAKVDRVEAELREIRAELASIRREMSVRLLRTAGSEAQSYGLMERLHVLEERVMDIDLVGQVSMRRQ